MKTRWLALCLLFLLICPSVLAQGETTDRAEIKQEQKQEEEAQFYGLIGKRLPVYLRGTNKSYRIGYVEAGEVVDVYQKGRSYTCIAFGKRKGYVDTKYIERVQRKNPFDGPMPGTSEHIGVGYVLEDTSFKPDGYKYRINVSEGSWISVEEIRDGYAYFPYMRLEENVRIKADKLEMYDFVPWNEARPGDLLYAFTTFYPTTLNKAGNEGRMFNIALATERLTGIRVEPGENFSFNEICAPYSKENGYQSAPILAGDSKFGYGGGVCQVCSTIYNIVLRVPTVIVDMNWHSQGGVSYLPAGYDATVGTNSDMVFQNIFDYPIRIEFESKNGVMTAFMFRDYEN